MSFCDSFEVVDVVVVACWCLSRLSSPLFLFLLLLVFVVFRVVVPVALLLVLACPACHRRCPLLLALACLVCPVIVVVDFGVFDIVVVEFAFCVSVFLLMLLLMPLLVVAAGSASIAAAAGVALIDFAAVDRPLVAAAAASLSAAVDDAFLDFSGWHLESQPESTFEYLFACILLVVR